MLKHLFAVLVLGASCFGGSFTAASCSRTDVNAVINGPTHTAVDGDVINIPAGTCTWTSGVVIPSGIGISIIGAGTTDAHNPSGSGVTTIVDNYTSSPSWLFYFTPTFGASTSRVSSMNLSPQSGLSANSLEAPIAFQGTCTSSGCPNIRVDHLIIPGSPSWDGLTQQSGTIILTDNVFGVLDHNSAYELGTSGFYEFVNFNHSAWKGVGQYGDNSWANADTYGTNQSLYVETNYFDNHGSGLFPITETEGGFSGTGQGGGRVVCRFNTAVGLQSMCVNHGTESNGRPRGGRQMEFYKNSMQCPGSSTPACFNNAYLLGAGPRSGSLLSLENSFTGIGIDQFAAIAEYRALQSIGTFGPCDGSGSWDNNDGTTYFSGTIASVTGTNPYTITVSGSPGWTTNQWVSNGSPYSVHDVTINNGSEIVSNTANSLTVNAWTSIAYANGDSVQILRATMCIDQSSRGAGDLLSGSSPTPTGWVHEVSDPVYEAGDTNSNGATVFGNISSNTARIIANRDFYAEVSQSAQSNATTPFNGTVGTGYGTLANRPTTCTTGVGYWAQDQGNWNTSGSGGQGILYTCVSTNTWATFFTPYTYPHPLTGVVPSWTGVLAASRAEDWGSNAGLPPVITYGSGGSTCNGAQGVNANCVETTLNPWTPPTRTVQCVTTACNTVVSNAGSSTPAQINAAIASASPGSYVRLPAGTYTINANITFWNGSTTTFNGITLRGDGPQSTILNFSGANTEIQWGVSGNGSGALSSTSPYAVGTNIVTVTGATSTPVVGNLAWFSQTDGGWNGTTYVDNGGLFICGVDYSQCSNNSTPTGTHLLQQQMVTITSVTSLGGASYIVGFSPGLYMPNWCGGTIVQCGSANGSAGTLNWQNSNVWGYGDGVEAMTIVFSNLQNERIDMESCYASWIKGTRLIGAPSVHSISVGTSKNNLVMNNYIFGQNPNQLTGPTQEPLGFQNDGDNLALNNIVHGGVGVFGGGTTEGNVFAYGYYFDSQSDNDEEGYFQHYPGSAFTLFEGNQTGTMRDDDTHGTHTLNTDFRNYLSGYSAPYQIPNCVAVVIDNFARFDNVVGNVLGGGSGCASYQTTTGGNGFVYVLATSTDTLALSSLMRWGNYDTITGAVRWCGNSSDPGWVATCSSTSEVPTTLSGNATPFQNAVPSTTTLPASFFMDTAVAHPSGGTGLSWWKTCSSWTTFPTSCAAYTIPPFPTSGPDVTGGVYASGFAYDNPAAIAYKHLPIDTSFDNTFTVTASSWSGGVETLTVNLGSIAGAATHIMGGFRLSGVPGGCLPSSGISFTGRADGEILMVATSATTHISYALVADPGANACAGTMKFPDVRQFDERVFQADSVTTTTGPAGLPFFARSKWSPLDGLLDTGRD